MLKQLTLASSILLILTACGSNSQPSHKPTYPEYLPVSTVNNTPKGYDMTIDINQVKKIKLAELNEELNNPINDVDYAIKVHNNNKTYTSGKINLSEHMPINQVADVSLTHQGRKSLNNQNYFINQNQKIRGYRQDYSVVAGFQTTGGSHNVPDLGRIDMEDMSVSFVQGLPTSENQLPKTGTYHYSGAAFTQNETGGRLNYDINFDQRTGQGNITGIREAGDITLQAGKIQQMSHTNSEWDNSIVQGMGIHGSASSSKGHHGAYQLGIFGKNAEEIAGVVTYQNDGVIGFGGKRDAQPKP